MGYEHIQQGEGHNVKYVASSTVVFWQACGHRSRAGGIGGGAGTCQAGGGG